MTRQSLSAGHGLESECSKKAEMRSVEVSEIVPRMVSVAKVHICDYSEIVNWTNLQALRGTTCIPLQILSREGGRLMTTRQWSTCFR